MALFPHFLAFGGVRGAKSPQAHSYGPATPRETPHIFEGTLASLLDGPAGPHGVPWGPMGLPGTPRGPIGTPRGPTGPTWPLGAPWDPSGPKGP